MDLWWLSDDFSIFDTQSKTPRPIRRSFSNLIVSTNTNTHLPIIENLAIRRYVLLAFSSEKLCIHPCRYFEREVKHMQPLYSSPPIMIQRKIVMSGQFCTLALFVENLIEIMRVGRWQRCMLMGDPMGHPRVSGPRLRDINWRATGPLLLFAARRPTIITKHNIAFRDA